jgi:hypothetical protein
MRKIFGTTAAALFGVLAFAGSANATTSLYNFTLDGLTGTLPSEPPYWGSVSVNDFGGTSHLSFDVTLNSSTGFYFNDSKAFQAFDYLLGGTVTTTTIATAGFTSAGLGSYSAPAIIVPSDATKFNWAILCATACAGGNPDGKISQLTFDVFGSNLSLESITNAKNFPDTAIFFAADAAFEGGPSTLTGNIGATLASAVPEPATWAMFLLGFGGIGLMLRSRRRRDAILARISA